MKALVRCRGWLRFRRRPSPPEPRWRAVHPELAGRILERNLDDNERGWTPHPDAAPRWLDRRRDRPRRWRF